MKAPHNFLKHILDECIYLTNTASKITYDIFLNDETIQRAFVRSIEIIGEATKNIDSNFKSKYSDLEWKKMAGMRDKLIHGYFEVNFKIVWDIAINKAPKMISIINKILSEVP